MSRTEGSEMPVDGTEFEPPRPGKSARYEFGCRSCRRVMASGNWIYSRPETLDADGVHRSYVNLCSTCEAKWIHRLGAAAATIRKRIRLRFQRPFIRKSPRKWKRRGAPTFLLQGDGSQDTDSCCGLIAIVNAARFYGISTPNPSTPEWGFLRDISGCRHGPCINEGTAALQLGMEVKEISVDEVGAHLPAVLNVRDPEARGLHAALAIEADSRHVTLVNYRCLGPVVERVSWKWVRMPDPGNVNRKAWAVEFTGKEPPVIVLCPSCRFWWYRDGESGPRHFECDLATWPNLFPPRGKGPPPPSDRAHGVM